MIKNMDSLSIAESAEYIVSKKDSGMVDMTKFIKKFTKLKPEKAKELRKNLEGLDLIKLNSSHISKLIDLLPSDKPDLNRVFSDANLDEDENNKILDVIKQFS